MSIFERASRRKYRFNYNGVCTVEDLWNLDMSALDAVYRNLAAAYKEMNAEQEDSLIQEEQDEQSRRGKLDLEGRLAVVKHIFTLKKDWAERAARAQETKQRKQRLLELKAKIEDQELEGKSAEEIQAMIDGLDAA